MTGQADFFGVPEELHAKPAKEPQARRKGVTAAPFRAEQTELAARLPAAIHLGTSSWSYPGWEGLVYEGSHSEAKLARDGLPAYAVHPLLHTVGIDRTFYGPIGELDYARYAGQVPAHFRFLVKAPMAITSSYLPGDGGRYAESPYYFDPEYAAREFVLPALAGLGEKAGPLVFQFPPQRELTRNPDLFVNRLYRFLKALPPYPLYAVEIRDPELMTHRFFMCLKTTGVHFCLASHARMPGPAAQIAALRAVIAEGPFIARWSLHSGFKYEDAKARYYPFNRLVDEDPDSRAVLAEACVQATRAGQPCFVIVNNKAEGSSPLSIEKLAAAIAAYMKPGEPNVAAQTD